MLDKIFLLIEKFSRKCAYCHIEDVPLEIEHYYPKSRGGTDRVSNLTIACRECNQDKGNRMPDEWISVLSKSKRKKDKVRLENVIKVKSQLKKPLKDAASVNATRWKLFHSLKEFGVPLETGTGAQTKMQRIQHKLPKTHYFDALVVGKSTTEIIKNDVLYSVSWFANGRGNRQMARVDKCGFPLLHLAKEKYDNRGKRKGHRERKKLHFDFMTGDIVVANVKKGKKQGLYKGRIAVRSSGFFNIKDVYTNQIIQGISHKDCRLIQRSNGWTLEKKAV